MIAVAAAALALAVVTAVSLLWQGLRLASQRLASFQDQVAGNELADLFIFIPTGHMRLASAVAAVLCLGLALLLEVPWWLAGASTLLLLWAPGLAVRKLRERRHRRLLRQLPDALALLSGLLRAGQALLPALTQLAQRQAAPLGQELALLLRKQRLGVPLDEALGQWHQRVPEPEIATLALSIRVAQALGGNLAEALQRLGDTHRERLMLRDKLDALTSQGRLQGWIVGLMPLGLMLVLHAMDPAAMSILFTTVGGWCALAVIAILELAGLWMIRRIVQVDI
jgi:tight adherence protein B